MSLAISFRSETLKLKRTLSLYLCILGAAFGPLMSLMENLRGTNEVRAGRDWTKHFLEGHDMVTGVLLPWFVILMCALLAQLEHKDRSWKQVLASPQRMIDVFLAKFATVQLMIALFLLFHLLFLGITGVITELAQPQLINGGADLLKIFGARAQSWILLLGISAIQFWLSLRFKSFIPPLGIGLVAWFIGPMMVFEFKTSAAAYYPYAFTILGVWPPYAVKTVTYQWYSVLTAVVFLTIAFAEFRRRGGKG